MISRPPIQPKNLQLFDCAYLLVSLLPLEASSARTTKCWIIHHYLGQTNVGEWRLPIIESVNLKCKISQREKCFKWVTSQKVNLKWNIGQAFSPDFLPNSRWSQLKNSSKPTDFLLNSSKFKSLNSKIQQFSKHLGKNKIFLPTHKTFTLNSRIFTLNSRIFS